MTGSCCPHSLFCLTILLIHQHPVSGWIAGSSNAAAYWNGGSKEAKPVVVINRRHVPTDPDKLEAYNEAHKTASDFMMKQIKGTCPLTRTSWRLTTKLIRQPATS